MFYSSYVSNDTIRDAEQTYNTHYRSKYGVLNDNFSATFLFVSCQQLKELKVKNIGWHRLTNVSCPEDAYPLHDRPRNDKDILSIYFHINVIIGVNKSKMSPPVVFKIRNKYIFLDGMHRLVALFLTKKPIRICLFDFDVFQF